jgi:D-3-phosphoglycerate dehydrogenase / 2-oxoglutarate reductase
VRALFVDANDTLAAVTEKLLRDDNLPVGINRNPARPMICRACWKALRS